MRTSEQTLRALIREELEVIFEIAMEQRPDGEWSPSILTPEDDSCMEEGKKKSKSKKYAGKKYTASSGSVAAIKKHKGSVEKAVSAGAFDWADDPYAAAQAAHIVAVGKPTVAKGSKK
jgi:hypothetical protein